MPTPRWLYAWALGAVALGAVSLLLPLYLIELGADSFLLGLLAASAAAAGAPGAFLFGRIADRTGRKRALMLGALSVITVALVLVPVVRPIPVVIATNVAIWFSFSAVGPVLTLLVVHGVEESAWQNRIARLSTLQGWGWAGGLLLEALWTGIGEQYMRPIVAQRVLFFVCAACATGAVFGARLYLPNDPELKTPTADRVHRAVLRARRRLSPGRLMSVCSQSRLRMVDAAIPARGLV